MFVILEKVVECGMGDAWRRPFHITIRSPGAALEAISNLVVYGMFDEA